MNNLNINIIGGAYIEECSFPRRQIFRGSGGRAAAFLSSVDIKTVFHTTLGRGSRQNFEKLAEIFGYTINCLGERDEIVFRYNYPLASPVIFHNSADHFQYDKQITCDNTLVFGMLENRPAVNSKKVVYDAQDGCRAVPFESNGSSAEEIALVLSLSEGKALSGKTDPNDIVKKLMVQKNLSTVVLKCGPQGAMVSDSKGNTEWVSPFKSKRVYKIGSGDIFSAAFAYAWMLHDIDPIVSTWFASKCCSLYVETGIDKFSLTSIADALETANSRKMSHASSLPCGIPKGYIYLAGPFFNTAQQWLINDVRRALLDMGFYVFSPIHDVGIGSAEMVATKDLQAIEKADVVLAILDGLDAGTLFEIGFAKAKGIKIVAIAESTQGEALTMITGSGCEIIDDLTTGIYAACWELMSHV